MKEYDQVGAEYRTVRSPHIGVPEILECAESYGRPISILDLGCGNGFPIAERLVGISRRYLGVDSSAVLAGEFERNIEGAAILVCSMDAMELSGERFDLVFGFGSIFHLPPDRQRIALRLAADAVAAGGTFIFTSHNRAGYVEGRVHGVTVPHWSLDESEYVDLVCSRGLNYHGYWVGSGGNGFYKFTQGSAT